MPCAEEWEVGATLPNPGPITFAIPFYRGRDYLVRAVASVARQSVPEWQLLVCDDSPAGDAAPVLDPRDGRVRYIHNGQTLGMAGNWNRCLDLAETDLVTLLHADDELLPNYTQAFRAAAARYPGCAALFCGARVVGPDSEPVFSFADWIKRVLAPAGVRPRRLQGPRALARLLRVNSIMCPTVCYRRSALGARRFDPRWRCALDLAFFARLLADGAEFVGLPTVAYAYRRHAENATAGYTESLLKFTEESALYDELAAEAEGRGWPEVARVSRAKVMVRLHLLFRTTHDVCRGRFAPAWEKARLFTRLALSEPAPAVPAPGDPCGT
jgi:glycosyltransferase involved in cell wall biosynthesis